MMPGSTKETELTFGDGARALFGGVRYVMGSPSVWPLAIVPVLMCIATVTACTWAGYSFGADALAPHLPTGGVTARSSHGRKSARSSASRTLPSVLPRTARACSGFLMRCRTVFTSSIPSMTSNT